MDVIKNCNIRVYFRIYRNFYLFVIQKWVRMSLNAQDGFAILTVYILSDQFLDNFAYLHFDV